MPDLDVDVRDGLTGVNVDDLVVEGNRNTRLIVRNILTDVLAANICKETKINSSPCRGRNLEFLTIRTLGHFRRQKTGRVASEELGHISVLSVARRGLVVVRG